MNAEKRHKFLSQLKRDNPSPRTELEYSSTFELLISVILSAQATDVSVNKATKELYKVANSPKKIFALGENNLRTYIKTIGLYNSKAKNIIKTCKILMEKYNSVVPKTRTELEGLPGVGRKTANVILNTAFREPTMAVDTHIFRISNRTKFAPGKTVLQVEKKLLKVISKEFILDAHHWLILHGRYVCTARKPKCGQCSVYDLCEFKGKTN
ncbi:MAG: endonuclease III [Pseudomonadota bacterium]|nr:endonuclease III [Pseudomonadota bacterium]